MSQNAFKVYRDKDPLSSSLSDAVPPNHPPSSCGANRYRLASADAAIPLSHRRRSFESQSPTSNLASRGGIRDGTAANFEEAEALAQVQEIARLKALLAQSECELDRTKSKLSKYSKENRSLRRRVAGYRAEVKDKDERLLSLEVEVESLRKGVTDAGTMERANRRMQEEQLRLENKRLGEERDRAILERNELMSRVGMMGVEVDPTSSVSEDSILLDPVSASMEHGMVGGSRRQSLQDLINKMGKNKISSGTASSMPSLDMANASSRKIMVTPESLLWDSEDEVIGME